MRLDIRMMFMLGLLLSAFPLLAEPAPDFVLPSDEGNVRLSELRGKVVMLNFWATWCGPCRQEMPPLQALQERHASRGFVLLGINVDRRFDKAQAMAAQLGVRYPLLHDGGKKVSGLYGVDNMPYTVLIDRDGNIRYRHRGYVPGVIDTYEREVRGLLVE